MSLRTSALSVWSVDACALTCTVSVAAPTFSAASTRTTFAMVTETPR